MGPAEIAVAGLKVFSDFIAPTKAYHATKKAAKADQIARILAARRQRINAVREQQYQIAANTNAAANESTTGSSIDLGANAAVASQSGANQSFMSATDLFNNMRAKQQQRASDYQFRGEMAASLAKFAESAAGQATGAKIKSLFQP